MTTFTIKQMQEMAGMPVPRIQSTVAGVFDRKTGEGQYGPWSLQNGTIEDSTGKMKILFKNLPDQKNLVGRSMVFKSVEGKHGLKGVEVKANEYQGKTTMELHVSKVALIFGEQEEGNVSLVTPSTRMPQNEPVEPQGAPIRHEDRKLGIATAKNRLTQLAGLYDLCWKTVGAMELRSSAIEESEIFDLSLHKDIATTLFIAAQREGLTDKMPVRTTDKFYKEGGQESPDHESQNGYDADRDNDEIPF